jgi:hypothetical protein
MAPPKPSRQVLTALPFKAHAFLHAAGTSRGIRAQLATVAYSKDAHAEGWRLLDAVSGRACSFDDLAPRANQSRDGYEALAEWERANLRRLRAAIVHHHPKYAAPLFTFDIDKTPKTAILRIAVLLARLDDLERSPARKATRAEDLAVLATLTARGLDASRRKDLAATIARTQSASPSPAADEPRGDKTVDDTALMALHAWYAEWSTVARRAIERADWRERLGLRHRKDAPRG